MPLEAEEKTPGKLRQALRTLFAFANAPELEEQPPKPEDPDDDLPEPPAPEPEPEPSEEEEDHDTATVTITPQEKGHYTMLTKQELVGRLMAHEHSSWSTEQTPVLLTLEERVLEQMLQELDRRQQEAPLTLKALQNELNTRDVALRAEYDQKLTTHVQALEQKQEREQLLAYFEARGWTPEDTATLPITALRRMHQELSPVSYLGNGLPRVPGQAWEDSLPDDNPKYE